MPFAGNPSQCTSNHNEGDDDDGDDKDNDDDCNSDGDDDMIVMIMNHQMVMMILLQGNHLGASHITMIVHLRLLETQHCHDFHN